VETVPRDIRGNVRDPFRRRSAPRRLQSSAKSASSSAVHSTLLCFALTCSSSLSQPYITTALVLLTLSCHVDRRDPVNIQHSAFPFLSLLPTVVNCFGLFFSRTFTCPIPAPHSLPSARLGFIASMHGTYDVDAAMCIIVFRTFQSIASKLYHAQEQ
jgi:hypothetical protein